MQSAVGIATVLTAFWAIQNRSTPVRATAAAFVLVGSAAAVYLALVPADKNSNVTIYIVLRTAFLLAAYQIALISAFLTGGKLTQAVINTNVVVIVVIDAITTSVRPQWGVITACVVQIATALYTVSNTV